MSHTGHITSRRDLRASGRGAARPATVDQHGETGTSARRHWQKHTGEALPTRRDGVARRVGRGPRVRGWASNLRQALVRQQPGQDLRPPCVRSATEPPACSRAGPDDAERLHQPVRRGTCALGPARPRRASNTLVVLDGLDVVGRRDQRRTPWRLCAKASGSAPDHRRQAALARRAGSSPPAGQHLGEVTRWRCPPSERWGAWRSATPSCASPSRPGRGPPTWPAPAAPGSGIGPCAPRRSSAAAG
jgi:hypothetical protein